MATKAKKLYFDFSVSPAVDNSQVFKLTAETDTTPGDRFGALLATMPPLTGDDQGKTLRAAEVTALIQSASQTLDTSLLVEFVDENDNPTPFYDTATHAVAAKAGHSAVFVQHPRVKISVPFVTSGTFRGTLIVQRQHSIEV